MNILVANIGSTSFKYRLFDTDAGPSWRRGGSSGSASPAATAPTTRPPSGAAMADIAGEGKPLGRLSDLAAIGFKAVHAGPLGGARARGRRGAGRDGGVRLLRAGPQPALHRRDAVVPPRAAATCRSWRSSRRRSSTACDEAATTYAVPFAWTEELGVRRYGFHGASHRAASEHAQAVARPRASRHISCHLGGSSSLAAIRDGVADRHELRHVAAVGPAAEQPRRRSRRLRRALRDEAARPRRRRDGARAGHAVGPGRHQRPERRHARPRARPRRRATPRARLALDVFVRAIRHYLGAFLVELGGVDVLTFSGGIGENSPAIRAARLRGPRGVRHRARRRR